MTTTIRAALRLAAPTLLVLAVLGCTVGPGGLARAGDGPTAAPPSNPPATGSPDSGGPGGGSVGGSAGDEPVSTVVPVGPGGPDPSIDPGAPAGSPTLVEPVPGRLQLRPTPATSIAARLVDGRVLARLTWWSGVAPCSVLNSVRVGRADHRIDLAIIEGADRLDVACIEIAMLKATEVDLGVLGPGDWLIAAYGPAEPVTITIP